MIPRAYHRVSGDRMRVGLEKVVMATIRIRLVRSPIGRPKEQRLQLRGLGLRKVNQVVERENTPCVRGMVKKVLHLVHVDELP